MGSIEAASNQVLSNTSDVRPSTSFSATQPEPPSSPPTYRPTPIAQLKRLQENQQQKTGDVGSKFRAKVGYKPTKIPYVPVAMSGNANPLSSVNYNPQMLDRVEVSYSYASASSTRRGGAGLRYSSSEDDEAGSSLAKADEPCFSDDDDNSKNIGHISRIRSLPMPPATPPPREPPAGDVEEGGSAGAFDLVNSILSKSKQCDALIKSSRVIRVPSVLSTTNPLRRDSSGSSTGLQDCKGATPKLKEVAAEVKTAEDKGLSGSDLKCVLQRLNGDTRKTSKEHSSSKDGSSTKKTVLPNGSEKKESSVKLETKDPPIKVDADFKKKEPGSRTVDKKEGLIKPSSKRDSSVESSSRKGDSSKSPSKKLKSQDGSSKKGVSSPKMSSVKNGSSKKDAFIKEDSSKSPSKKHSSGDSRSRERTKSSDKSEKKQSCDDGKSGKGDSHRPAATSDEGKASKDKRNLTVRSPEKREVEGKSKKRSHSQHHHHRHNSSSTDEPRSSSSDRGGAKKRKHEHASPKMDAAVPPTITPGVEACTNFGFGTIVQNNSTADANSVWVPATAWSSLPVPNHHAEPVSEEEEDEEEDDTYAECLKIFNEYNEAPPPPKATQTQSRQQKKVAAAADNGEEPGQVGRKRVAHQADHEVYRQGPKAAAHRPSPSSIMNNRLLEMKRRMEEEAASTPVPLAASITTTFNNWSIVRGDNGLVKRRVAHGQAALPPARQVGRAVPATKAGHPCPARRPYPVVGATTAHCVAKGISRVAHTPSSTTLKRPVISAEFGSRIPLTIRQRYLNLIIDECLHIYDTEPDAFARGLAEEKASYDRSTNRTVYVNVVVNTIKRIRDEKNGIPAQQPARLNNYSKATLHLANNSVGNGAPRQSSYSVAHQISHQYNLGGKKAANVSYSIQRPKTKPNDCPLSGAKLYNALKSYVLQLSQLEENGFPLPHSFESGRAVVHKVDLKKLKTSDPNERVCIRCGHLFKITMRGEYLTQDECYFHWGKPYKRKLCGALETRYSCCQQGLHSDGCGMCNFHVVDCLDPDNLRGFIKTLPKTPPIDGNYGVYALDCEMCYTTMGIQLSRVTVIGPDMKPVFESLVKPENEVVDYNTRFSGIKAEDLENVTMTLRDVQAILLSKFNDQTILIGHSLESDFKALKLIHKTVVDTSVVFPHKMGLPFKKALRTLMAEHLKKIIQNDVDGHDSHEDAAACMELMFWKLKNDPK